MIYIYDFVYKLIRKKCPESMESHSIKSKHNKTDNIMVMKDDDSIAQARMKTNSMNRNKIVCTLIIMLIVAFDRMVFG